MPKQLHQLFSFYNVYLRYCHILIGNRFFMLFFVRIVIMIHFPCVYFWNSQIFTCHLIFSPFPFFLPSQQLSSPCHYNILINKVNTKLLIKSANKLPTSGTSRYAFTDGAYFSQSTCIFAIALGVAPIPNPHTPEDRTAAS